MSRLTIGSIITATLLIVGCGSNGGSSSSSLSDSSTPSNSSEANGMTQKIGKGYYVDSAVEGVNFQCGSESGVTDNNGTFTFESGSDCNFTLGGVKLRDINGSLLEDNITILETNETVAQLLQTLDSDGNASNGIQISKGAGKVIRETLPSLSDLNQDLLEAIHDRLKAELKEYHGKVVDRNQTIEHLNRTKAELEARHIRTHLDVEAEHRGRRDNNDSINGSININGHHNEDSNNSIRDEIDTHRGDINETGHNNSHVDMDNNGSMGEVMSGVHTHSNSDENSSPRNSVANSPGDMMRGNGEERESHNNQEQQEHSNNSSSQSVDNNTSMPPFTSNMGNHNSSNSQEHSGSSSSQQTGSHSQSNSGDNSNQSGSENHNNQNSSSNGSSHTSPTGRTGF